MNFELCALVRAIHALDPTMPVYDIQTMASRMSASLARQRFAMIMLGAFAGFALLLAVVGVYGVISHLVTRARTTSASAWRWARNGGASSAW